MTISVTLNIKQHATARPEVAKYILHFLFIYFASCWISLHLQLIKIFKKTKLQALVKVNLRNLLRIINSSPMKWRFNGILTVSYRKLTTRTTHTLTLLKRPTTTIDSISECTSCSRLNSESASKKDNVWRQLLRALFDSGWRITRKLKEGLYPLQLACVTFCQSGKIHSTWNVASDYDSTNTVVGIKPFEEWRLL